MRRRLLWSLLLGIVLAILTAGAGAWWLRGQLRSSLPQIDGTLRLAGLAGPVKVTRDALGIPTIRGGSRDDVARASRNDGLVVQDLRGARGADGAHVNGQGGPRRVEARAGRDRHRNQSRRRCP